MRQNCQLDTKFNSGSAYSSVSNGEIAVLHSALPFLPHLSQPVAGRDIIATHTTCTYLKTEAKKG